MKVLRHKYLYVWGSDGYALVAEVLTEKGIKYIVQWGAAIKEGYVDHSSYAMRFFASFEEAEEYASKM